MRPPEVRPFPWERLSRTTRAEASWLRAVLRRAPPDLAAVGRVLGARLALEVCVEALAVHAVASDALAQRLPARVVALLFEQPGGARAVVDLDAPLAGTAADRVLGGETDAVAWTAPEHVGEVERGLVAAVVLEALAAGGGDLAGWRLVTALDSSAGIVEALGAATRVLWVALGVRLGGARGQLRLLLPEASLAPPPGRVVLAAGARARIAGAPVRVRAEVGLARLGRRELATLRAGDVVVLDEASAVRVSGATRIAGRACLRWQGGPRAARWAEVRERTLVCTGEEGRLGTESTELEADEAAREALADAPVEVTVELARTVLRAEELMALRPGEIVRMGRPIGAEVHLVAGGRVLARGELVDVEGEVGVRVLSTR